MQQRKGGKQKRKNKGHLRQENITEQTEKEKKKKRKRI